MSTKTTNKEEGIRITISIERYLDVRHHPVQKGTFIVKLAYWPPLVLLLLGGAFYFNERINQEQPSKITPSTTSPQPEVPAKIEQDTDQEQPPSTQQEFPAKGKTETEVYKLF